MNQFHEEYFEQNYPNYYRQNPRRKLRFYTKVIERNLPDGTPRRIHDMGCAFGGFVGSLDEDWEIWGSDLSAYAIDRARKEHPRGHFAVGDASMAPVFDEKFTVVTAMDVIEHVPDLDAVAASVRSQLVDGGIFVFVVPVFDGLSGPVIRLLDSDETHIHKWARRKWFKWVESIDFELLEWQGMMRYLLPGIPYYVHIPTRLFRHHTPSVIVACRPRHQAQSS